MVEKTGPYNLLFLFSIGIDKTKAMGLLRGLTEFKRSYDLNLRIKNMLPDLYAEDRFLPQYAYSGSGARDP